MKTKTWLAALIAALLLLAVGCATPTETAHVLRVVDGDTIEVVVGGRTETVRYIGIDTPETVDPQRPVQCFGNEASERNRALVEGKVVRLEKDVSDRDRYGRLLRYVYVDGEMVNAALVRDGYARASTYPPDMKYQALLAQLEREARENNRGLWAACRYPRRLADGAPGNPVLTIRPAIE